MSKMTLGQVRDYHLSKVSRFNRTQNQFPHDSTVLTAFAKHHKDMADAIDERIKADEGMVLVPIDERTGICTDAQRWLLKHDLDTLVSFHMQCDDMDADGYTTTASEMARLAEIGVVRKVRGSVYEVTSIGCFLCENYWGQNPKLPLMTTKDYNERSAKAMLTAALQENAK